MKKLLKMLIICVLSACFAFVVAFSVSLSRMQNCFESELYGNVIRLHILANSDSEADQKAKLMIKNRVIDHISEMVSDADSSDQAAVAIETHIPEINDYVQQVSNELGYDYRITASFSEEKYPVRYYDGFAFPAGTYKSLRINLGSGEGKNWWCVLYPSVCTSPSEKTSELLSKAGMSDETVNYICQDEKYIIRFRFLEWLGL